MFILNGKLKLHFFFYLQELEAKAGKFLTFFMVFVLVDNMSKITNVFP